nr:zinc finger, CCHC-type [Tanacetum cinerariifolium]
MVHNHYLEEAKKKTQESGTLSLVSEYLKDLEECMDDVDSRVAKEVKLFDALEYKSVVIEVDDQKIAIFTKVPLRAFGEPFMSDYSRKMVKDVNVEIHGVKFKVDFVVLGSFEVGRDEDGNVKYGPVAHSFIDIKDDMERALEMEAYFNPFKNVIVFKKLIDFLGSLTVQLKNLDWGNEGYTAYKKVDGIGMLVVLGLFIEDEHAPGTKENIVICAGHFVTKIACFLGYCMDDEIKKCSEPIDCEYWISKMLAAELDVENTCLKKETKMPTQAEEGSREPTQEHGGLNSSWGDWNASLKALPEAPPATATVVVRNAYTRMVNEQQEVACLMLASMTLEIQKNLRDLKLLHEIDNLCTIMKEYVQFKTGRAVRHNQVYNWEISQYAETTTDDAGTSTTIIPGPVTIEEKAKKKNDVKARRVLLMALPNEHLMTFNQCKDAKTLFAAIETRFVLDTMSLDDLYNNFKIVEQEVRGTTSTNTSSQNMDFMSSPSSNNTSEVPIVFRVSTGSPQVSTTNLSNAIVYAFLANQPNGSQLVHEDLEKIHEDDLEEIDLEWQVAIGTAKEKTQNQETTRKTTNTEDTSSKVMVEIDGAGFDWSHMADDEALRNIAFMALSNSEYDELRVESHKSKCNLADFKRVLGIVIPAARAFCFCCQVFISAGDLFLLKSIEKLQLIINDEDFFI